MAFPIKKKIASRVMHETEDLSIQLKTIENTSGQNKRPNLLTARWYYDYVYNSECL
jgi:hypothetical protein